MEHVVTLLIAIVVFPIVYISKDKWHGIAEKYKKMVNHIEI